ncbi:Ser-Thr-rich GPI-anchored membrane family protein, partial [Chloroflexota bacterium]
ELGSTHSITWTSSNAGSSVKIELYKGSSSYKTIASSTSNDGSYSWAIPSSYDDYSSYKIKITDTGDSSCYDYSDSYFTLSSLTNPDPRILSVDYPASISLGDYATIKVMATNNEEEANWQTIAISFPKNPSDVSITAYDLDSSDIYWPGEELPEGYGAGQIPLIYPLAEGYSGPWPNGEDEYLEVRVKPESEGTFTFYVKSCAGRQPDGVCSAYDPSSGTKDQQNEYVQQYSIQVGGGAPPSPSIPEWRKDIQVGDILLHRKDWDVACILLQEMTHSGIYIGDGWTVEARPQGIKKYKIEDWDYKEGKSDSDTWVELRRVESATVDKRIQAAEWAIKQTERSPLPGFDPLKNWLSKSSDPEEEGWYCSELVWAAYKNQDVDLDPDRLIVSPVSPDELHDSTNPVDEHKEMKLTCSESLRIEVRSPVELVITDPEGLSISRESNEIVGAVYLVADIDDDGDPNKIVGISEPKPGDYAVKVIPEAGAPPKDTYSLTASIGGQIISLAENTPLSDIPDEPYILTVKVPSPPPPGNGAVIPPPNIVSSADSHKLMLDRSVEVVNTASVRGNTYYVVKYTNALPFASGIEVLSEDGALVSDTPIVRSVFSYIGWQEAAEKINASDIDTLEEVLKISSEIDSAISPVRKATNVVIEAVDELQGLGVDIPILGRVSAWDAVVKAYPQSAYIEDKLRTLDEYLNKWGDASQSLSQSIPTAIQALQELQAGRELNPDLQSAIGKSVIGMASLEDTTNDCASILSDTATVVSKAASGLEEASSEKYVGKYISPVASKVDGLYDYISNLRKSAQTFSNDLSQQQAKLTTVTDAAEAKENELYAAWTSRQGAAAKVYGVVFGGSGLVVILVIIIILLWFRRRRLAEQLISPTEPKLVSTSTPIDTTPKVMAPEKPQTPPATPMPVPPLASVPDHEPTELDTILQCTLTIKINGEGTVFPPQGSHQFKEGTVININASPSEGWKFVGWVGDIDEPHQHFSTITMNTDKTITATFQKLPPVTPIPAPEPTKPDTAKRTLIVKINGEGMTNPPQGSHQFKEGTVININASPPEGWKFVGWVGDVEEPYAQGTTLTMDKNKTIIANFQKL